MSTPTKNCKACGNQYSKFPSDSRKYWEIKTYCSKKCANNANKNYEQLKGIKRPAEVIERMRATMFKSGSTPWNKGTENHAIKQDKHPNWKGDKVGYTGLHMWVYSQLGKPGDCENCGKTGLSGKQIHWANASHEYKRELTDWLRLCAKCHMAYDKVK